MNCVVVCDNFKYKFSLGFNMKKGQFQIMFKMYVYVVRIKVVVMFQIFSFVVCIVY